MDSNLHIWGKDKMNPCLSTHQNQSFHFSFMLLQPPMLHLAWPSQKSVYLLFYLDANLDAKNYGCDDSSWLSPCHDDITMGVTQYMAIKFIYKNPKFVLARRRRRVMIIMMLKRRI